MQKTGLGSVFFFIFAKNKKMKKLFLLSALLISFSCLFSQSLLWKVSGKNIQSPSYLYGTIHIMDERVFAFDTTVLTALYSCDAFAMEVLMDELDLTGVSQSMLMPKGQTISNLLSKEDFKLLDNLCKEKLGTGILFLNRMKPFFVAGALEGGGFSKDKDTALDLFLLKKARENHKNCFGLEKYIDQIKAIDAVNIKEQVKMLEAMLHDTLKLTKEGDLLLNSYLNFDLDKLNELSQDTSMSKKFQKALITNRNKTMAKQFSKISKDQTLFCAVGAAHLVGDKGVLALLRKKGYTVEPVVFKWK